MTTPESKAAPAWREWAGRIGAVLFGLVIALILLEALLRVAAPLLPPAAQITLRPVAATPFSPPPDKPKPLWSTSQDYGLVVRTETGDQLQQFEGPIIFHLVTINWLDPNSYVAFRVPSPDWGPTWPVNAVVVGDSFTFCYTEYADCWVSRLQSEYGLSVVNLGMSGTGTTSHARILNTFGLPYKPQMVIWEWWGNDFYDDYSLVETPSVSGATVILPQSNTKKPKTPEIVKWLRVNSAVYVLTDQWLQSTKPQAAVDYLVDPYHVSKDGVTLNFGRPYLERSFNMADPVNQKGFQDSKAALLGARDRLAESNTPLVILLLPTKEEVYRRWTEPQLGAAWFDMIQAGRKQMLALCQTEHLTCLDATDALTTYANQNQQIYWADDMHLNPVGNQILAGLVENFLKARGLVK